MRLVRGAVGMLGREPLHDGSGQWRYRPGGLLAEGSLKHLGAGRHRRKSFSEARVERGGKAYRCLEHPVNEIGVPIEPGPPDQVAFERRS